MILFDNTSLVSVPAKAAVLLIFMPDINSNRSPETQLGVLADTLRKQFGQVLHVLKIDQQAHRVLTSSFQITFLPTFVLVRGGVELWRYQGVLAVDEMIPLLRQLLFTNTSGETPGDGSGISFTE